MKVNQTRSSPFSVIAILAIHFCLSLTASAADDPFKDMTPSMTYPRATITHYSATPRGGSVCRFEGGVGGKDESPSGIRPLSATITKPGMIKGKLATLTAVPQSGGNSGTYGCFFALPDAYPGKLFYAGDRYGTGSNGKVKVDISSPCTSIVNKSMKSKIVVYDCPGKKGGSGKKITRKDHEPTPKSKTAVKKPSDESDEDAKTVAPAKVAGQKKPQTAANAPVVGGFSEDGDTPDLAKDEEAAKTEVAKVEPPKEGKKTSSKKVPAKAEEDKDTSLLEETDTKITSKPTEEKKEVVDEPKEKAKTKKDKVAEKEYEEEPAAKEPSTPKPKKGKSPRKLLRLTKMTTATTVTIPTVVALP